MSSTRLRQSFVSVTAPRQQPTSLSIQESVAGSQRSIRLKGQFDLLAAPLLEQTLRRACVGPPGTAFVLDLSELTFIDSSGVRTVLLASELCARAGCEFRLVEGPPEIQRVFEVTGLSVVLPFRPRTSE